MTLIGIASPKGGVGKSTLAVNLAAVLASIAADLDVAVIDADENRSALTWITDGPDDAWSGVRVATADTPRVLRSLRDADLPAAFVDLPGARRGGEMRALLTGSTGNPVCDALIVPTQLPRGDLDVVIGSIVDDIAPAGIPYLLVLTRVPPASMSEARDQLGALADAGIAVCRTPIRDYAAWREANNRSLPLTHVGGGSDTSARQAEDDLRALARDTFTLAGLDLTVPDTDRTPRRRLVPLTVTATEEDR